MFRRHKNIHRVAIFLVVFSASACHEKKQIAAARANAVGYALARCDCEKLRGKNPPGDLTLCTQQMMQATRYLKINFELGKFSDEEKRLVQLAGDDAFDKCMRE